jgi:hypothetical protein
MGWEATMKKSGSNPTKSIPVNDLIKKIKKKEVQKQGKNSMARGGLVAAEFEQTLGLLEDNNDIKKKFMVSNAARFQYAAMVARIDDTANIKEADLKPNPRFDFTLLAQMC